MSDMYCIDPTKTTTGLVTLDGEVHELASRAVLETLLHTGVLVKVEATDRICLRHQQLPPVGSRSKRCYMGDAIGEDCKMVNVVRLET